MKNKHEGSNFDDWLKEEGLSPFRVGDYLTTGDIVREYLIEAISSEDESSIKSAIEDVAEAFDNLRGKGCCRCS